MSEDADKRSFLQELWDDEKNSVQFAEMRRHSRHKYWWRCKKEGHSFQAEPSNVKSVDTCPYASGRRVLKGFNDFATREPSLASFWHPNKNPLTPDEYQHHSNKVVWWVCSAGHEFQRSISQMVTQGPGCAYCSGKKALAGFNDLATLRPDTAKDWHPTKNGLFRPTDVTVGSSKKAFWICAQGHDWEAAVSSRTGNRTGCPYCANQFVWKGFNDLASQKPSLVSEWDFERNSTGPDEYLVSSTRKAWWKCSRGHGWETIISLRVSGSGCPMCANVRVSPGENDLGTRFPEIAATLHPEKNPEINPDLVSSGSRKVAWWVCPLGHEYRLSINDRTRGGGCQYCAGKKVLKGFNDFESRTPENASRWDKQKNSATPDSVSFGSLKKYWFTCERGHSFLASPNSFARSSTASGCATCAGKTVESGFNDLGTLSPETVRLWHPTRNLPLTPADVSRASSRKVWWQCLRDASHEWEATVSSRSRGAGCPICVHRVIIAGVNDLGTEFPALASEWHPTLNETQTPGTVSGWTPRKAWWQCSQDGGHVWAASIESRRSRGLGCPICSNQKTVPGLNDLASTHPHLVAEYMDSKNSAPITTINAGSKVNRWWKCVECAAEWRASSSSRTRLGSGCPRCAKPGYDATSEGYLYLLRKETLGLQQFGITNTPTRRLATHKKNGWELLDVVGPADGYWVVDTETALKQFFKDKQLLLPYDHSDKFDGYTESWNAEGLSFRSLKELLSALRDWENST